MLNINLSFGRESVFAVVDVSPGGASVAISLSSRGSASTVLASASSALTLEPRSDTQAKSQIAGQVTEAAQQAMKLYAAAGHKSPVAAAYVVLHAPWAITRLISSGVDYPTETYMDDAHVAALAQTALAQDAATDKTKLIEASVVRMAVNGYPTPDPKGSYARHIDVGSLVTECDPEVRGSVEGALHQVLPVANISWRSALRALMALARESRLEEDFLMIDMGAEATHIASLRDSSLEQLVVPEGARSILARVSAGRSADEVLGYMRMLSRDACASEVCDALKQSLATTEPELVRIFGESIAKIASAKRVSNDVLLCTHPDLEDWLRTFFTRIDFAQFTVTSLPLTPHTPGMLDMHKWVAGARVPAQISAGTALVNIESRS